jgi:hypothetical protein
MIMASIVRVDFDMNFLPFCQVNPAIWAEPSRILIGQQLSATPTKDTPWGKLQWRLPDTIQVDSIEFGQNMTC